jgi:hypothetical protein
MDVRWCPYVLALCTRLVPRLPSCSHRFLTGALLCDRCLVVSILSGVLRNLQVRAARFRRGNLVQPSTANRRWPGRSIPPQYFDLWRRFLQELKSVAVDRDAAFVASRARVSDVVCSFGSTLEEAKDSWNSVTATEATTWMKFGPACKAGAVTGCANRPAILARSNPSAPLRASTML